MKLNLFFHLFLTGVVSVTMQAVRHDYYLITTPLTWGNARSYCSNNYENLATVETNDDWERLNAEAARHGLPATGWVGLYSPVNDWFMIGVGYWFSYWNWGPGEPDNNGGNEHCVAINTNGYWDDCTCTDLKPFICYSGASNSFIAVPTPTMSWQDSMSYCWSHYTNLAISTNLTSNNELQQLALQQGASWLSLTRYSWLWADGGFPSGLQWGPGLPNNVDHDDNCASVNNSLLVDRECNSLFNFFCHTPYTLRYQVMRLKIKGVQSVSDTALQSAILQNIQQKLQAHGVWREISVTWRVQPDGNIFQKESKYDL